MKKLVSMLAIPLVALTLTACGNSHNQQATSSSKATTTKSSSQSTASRQGLDPANLTPQQNAALVLYYTGEHMPGAKQNDCSAHMAEQGQGAVVKIYNKDDAPKGTGPIYKTYPDGAQLLYSIILNHGVEGTKKNKIDATYYTIAGDKVYTADSDGGINKDGVTASEMVAYAQKHHGVDRVLNVAKNTKVEDLRNQTTTADNGGSQQGLTTQQLGTLVALYAHPDWFKAGVSDDEMWYESNTNGDHYNGPDGYSYVTANGDPTSWLYFKRDGDNVTVKYVDPKGDESVAEASMTTKHITVSGLVRDYYTNQSQKDEVNGYANKLKPESDYEHNN
ncbi:Lreu_0056 family protein [Limosilactobacillus kribbianus]|uniref:Lreu_0056 family protein n=1 Tax=Limosilactobacillus kribbianus TaxID=2982695 RepID=UPI0022642803|nr:hypothetical protein [Limosilactobacillus kribbianus]